MTFYEARPVKSGKGQGAANRQNHTNNPKSPPQKKPTETPQNNLCPPPHNGYNESRDMSDENNQQKAKKKRSLLNILTLMSLILLCLTGFLFYLSYRINAWEESFSLRDDFHISLYRRGKGCNLAFFTEKESPYTGSIVKLSGMEWPKIRGFGYTWGIYYRHFTWPEEKQWTLYISLWWPVVLFSILPGLFLYRKDRDQRRRKK
jgi:hypothetical protein